MEREKTYYWLKLKRDFFKRHDIRIIETMPNGKDYILFYLKLLCESVDHEGNLRFSDQIPYNEDMLATITNTNVDVVRIAIKILTGPTKLRPDLRYQTYVHPEGCPRKKIAKKYEEDLYEALYKFYFGSDTPSIADKITLRSLYPKWLEYKTNRTRASTNIKRINCTWKRFYAPSAIVDKELTNLSTYDLDVWIHKVITEHNLNSKQYGNFILILNQMLKYALLRDLIVTNPMNKLDINRNILADQFEPEPETQVFTDAEEDAMVSLALDDYRNNPKLNYPLGSLAVIFQFITGLRVGELCALKYEDVKDGILYIRKMVRDQYEVVNTTKSKNSRRRIPLTDEALWLIEETKRYHKKAGIPDAEFIFGGNEHLKPRVITDRYDTYCKRLGITHRSSHKARKTCENKILSHSSLHPKTVATFLGHSTEVMYKNYYFDRATECERNKGFIEALPSHSCVLNSVLKNQ